MDLKIGAVFSLAAETESEDVCDVTGIDDTIPERTEPVLSGTQDEDGTEEEEYFIANDEQWHSTPSDISTISADLNQSMNVSTDSALSDVIDQDCPPSLSMETVTQAPTDRSWSEDDMLPPVLEPEKLAMVTEESTVDVVTVATTDEDKNNSGRKCMKIFPSYLVLTNIRKVMNGADRISYRKVKRIFKECNNMCKKIYFRRRLEAGKDVFNVKSPSKQASRNFTQYISNAKNRKEGRGSEVLGPNRKVLDIPTVARRYEKHKAKGTKELGYKQMVSRVQRVIQHMPKDFKTNRTEIIDITSDALTLMEVEEKMKLNHEKYLMQIRTRELANLRTQIKMKRDANKCAKKIRKAEAQNASMVLSSGTSFKGRKRKTNTKYGSDFALTNRSDELLQYVAMAKIEKKLEKERKRMKEDLDSLKRRMSGVDSRKKPLEVVIDNPEENKVKKLRRGDGTVKSKDTKIKVKINVNARKTSGGNHLKRMRLKHVKASRALGDGVLIRDLPPDDQLINGMLCDGITDNESSKLSLPEDQRTGQVDSKLTDQKTYPYARSLLKSSLNDPGLGCTSTTVKAGVVTNRVPVQENRFLSTPELEQEKAQALRIPESVQKLFKVKTEPIDNGYNQAENTPLSHITPCSISATSSYSISVDSSTPVVSTQPIFKRIAPTLAPAPVLQTTKSPQKAIYLPTVFRQPAPTSNSNSLFINAGGVPIPVTLKAGPNGDKIVTVLVSPPSATTQKPTMTISHKNLSNTTSSSYMHTTNISTGGMKQVLSPVSSISNQDSLPVSKMPGGNIPHRIVINTSLTEPAAAKRTLSSSSQTPVAPHIVRIGSCKQTETENTASIGKVLPLPDIYKNTSTSLAQPKPCVSVAAFTPPTVMASPAAPASSTSHIQTTTKCKFYLVKVDDKNILIPMNPSASSPSTAFIVNSTSPVLQTNTKTTESLQTETSGPTTTPSLLTFPVMSSMDPSLNTVTTLPEDKQPRKPTATITPNIKYTSECGRLSLEKNQRLIPNFADLPPSIEDSPTPGIKEDSDKQPQKHSVKLKRRESKKSVDKYKTPEYSTEEIAHNDKITEETDRKNTTADDVWTPESGSELKPGKDKSENKEVTQVKDKAFTEVITDREEKLRKLKELIKEKQKAVEEIRVNRLKTD